MKHFKIQIVLTIPIILTIIIIIFLPGCGGGGGVSGGESTFSVTYKISGTVKTSSGAGVGDVTISYSGTSSATIPTNSLGGFTISNLNAGSYILTPSKSNYTFNPTSRSVTIISSDVISGVDFIATSSQATYLNISITAPADNFIATQSTIIINADIEFNNAITETRYTLKKSDGQTQTICTDSKLLSSCTWDASNATNFPNGEYLISVYAKADGVEKTATRNIKLVVLNRLASRWDKTRLLNEKVIPSLEAGPNNLPVGIYVYWWDEYDVWVDENTVCVTMEFEIIESSIYGYKWGDACPSYDCSRVRLMVKNYFEETPDVYLYTNIPEPASVKSLYQIEVYPDIQQTPPDEKILDVCKTN